MDNTLFEFEDMYSDYCGEVWRCKKCGDRVILTKDDIKNIKECPSCGAKTEDE